MIRVLIVDDEAPARRKLRRYLATDNGIEIVGEASTGAEALDRMKELKPALVFLDIQMPGMDGIAVVEALKENDRPQIIFVTAHDQYACRAFEVQALNYLLKPVDPERFVHALERAKKQLLLNEKTDLQQLLRTLSTPKSYARRLLINTGVKAFFLAVDQIDWVDAERNYIHIHAGKEVHLVRSTIEGFHSQLDPAQFARINRSQIVNLDSVSELRPWFHGEYRVLLKDASELTWSRRFAPPGPVRP
jgi:two-component system, LytTR family, response regulator